ncbi:histidine kinase [Pseudonocardia sp. HH130630-07]|nr:histidine kinase [Pseudonocardia sp. HH130630-07]
MSVRAKLTLSYAAYFLVMSVVLLAVVAVFLLRYVPEGRIEIVSGADAGRYVPDRGDLIEAFLPRALVALVGLGVVGLAGGWVLAGRVLRPLQALTGAARLAADGSLSHRIHARGPRDEFGELADVFDTMLARLERQFDEQRRFAANASHQLRTPLAVTRALIEVAQSDPDHDVGALLDRLLRSNRRMAGTVEALLLLSRIDPTTSPPGELDLSLLAEEAVETLYETMTRRGLAVTLDAQPAPARGSAALVQELATNLVHNAVVHNLEAGGELRIHTGVTAGGSAVLVVANTGPVLDPATVGTLVEPFARGAGRARDGDAAGVGLGLSVVDSVVRAHRGTLTLVPRPGGGLTVTVTLPPGPERIRSGNIGPPTLEA